MPHGARTFGASNGPVGVTPRLYSEAGSVAPPAIGSTFVPHGRDSVGVRSDPAAPGSAKAVVQFGPVPTNEVWRVERIAVSTTSTNATAAKVYAGSEDPANLVDQTQSGDGDISDQTNPIEIAGGSSLVVVWYGMSNGAQGTARFQYEAGRYQMANVGG